MIFYPEFLRIRRAYVWFNGIITALMLFVVFLIFEATHGHAVHLDVNGNAVASSPNIPLSVLFLGVGFVTAIYATVFATSLNRLTDNAELVWTEPRRRTMTALRDLAVDLIGIVAVYLTVFVVAVAIPLTLFGAWRQVLVDSPAPIALLLGVLFPMLFHAELQAATSWHRKAGGVMAGLSWPLFLILGALQGAPLPDSLHAVLIGLNFLNPLNYLEATYHSSDLQISAGALVQAGVTVLPLATRALLAVVLAVAAYAIAVFGWNRVEL